MEPTELPSPLSGSRVSTGLDDALESTTSIKNSALSPQNPPLSTHGYLDLPEVVSVDSA
jgi:hypothetical protein